MIKLTPAPLLIQVKKVNVESLVNEQGEKPDTNLQLIQKTIKAVPHLMDTLMQHSNFRLIQPVKIDNLKLFLINIQEHNQDSPIYNLYEIHPEPII